MKHLTRQELLLYVRNIGLTKREKENVREHLQNCSQCQHELAGLKLKLKQIKQKNSMQCDYFLQKLPAFLDKDLNDKEYAAIENHLQECETCGALFSLLTEIPNREILPGEIPAAVSERIENQVLFALNRDRTKNATKKVGSKMVEEIDTFIQEVILSFRSVQQDFAFRGDDKKELKIIEHAGGNLLIETGIKNATLELTSIFEEFTVKAKTDKDGVVIFKNLAKGDYIVHINGYFLEDIKIKKQL